MFLHSAAEDLFDRNVIDLLQKQAQKDAEHITDPDRKCLAAIDESDFRAIDVAVSSLLASWGTNQQEDKVKIELTQHKIVWSCLAAPIVRAKRN